MISNAAEMSDVAIVLVVAVADNGVIGQGNAIPWRLKSDLQRFKQLTLNKPVIMGRKTYQSIGRPLPGRTNIVITRDAAFTAPGVVVAPSFAAAEQVARGDALRRFATEIAVIGGAEIYAQWLPLAARIELTEVHAQPAGDTSFPPIDPELWREVARERHTAGPHDSADFSYVTYRRDAAC
ncbi:Dihydrofolate reductase type 3 [Rhodopseudomonas palustris]|uniref:Dihydrofolate reductase n=2 Tax=Rhodopseudomonas palustris (strain ATCC BAA-98 / CGA009) TaxID=258594 RepID=Q6N448_RHOPA|nr:Dihydrofolate reductase [Rhodopseudomonas palustris TIE-1]QQM05037.1 Dihydrofolate reductase type 3 [Rhodopseudomonas palustris]RIA03685.1 dihydrofolate reductase [Rhodopseudomonas palustris]RJF69331.1 dihydrofolate reductase [Rhodopseudomonas palustris]CAE28933.1 dihydrofolate reductase [Rhodopseudomonas palustris CGA009]